MIDPNEALPGYSAVAAEFACVGCELLRGDLCEHDIYPDANFVSCFSDFRADGESVIFIKKQENISCTKDMLEVVDYKTTA